MKLAHLLKFSNALASGLFLIVALLFYFAIRLMHSDFETLRPQIQRESFKAIVKPVDSQK